jgi:dynein light chain roadblock-type
VQSEIEEIIERIKNHKGSERYIILGKGGEVLRSHPVSDESEAHGERLSKLAKLARGVVRDLDPTDDLNFFRLRTQTKEILIGVHSEYLVIVQQQWSPAPPM